MVGGLSLALGEDAAFHQDICADIVIGLHFCCHMSYFISFCCRRSRNEDHVFVCLAHYGPKCDWLAEGRKLSSQLANPSHSNAGCVNRHAYLQR